MNLSKNELEAIRNPGVTMPAPAIFNLPEKVLQFGTGILLRGLPDDFIDKANGLGIFGGRIVVVKSTPGTVSDFEKQNSRYTICVRGMEEGKSVELDSVNTAISRVISA